MLVLDNKALYIEFPTYSWFSPVVKIEGEEIKPKYDDKGRVFFSDSFSSDSVKVEVYTRHMLEGPLWWLVNIFFFIISIFGILDQRGVYKYHAFRTEFRVRLDGDLTKLVMRNNRYVEGDEALVIESPQGISLESNTYYKDLSFKRRKTAMTIIRILLYIALVAGIILIVSNL